MKTNIYVRREKYMTFPELKWFTTKEAAYNYGKNDKWTTPEELDVTLSVAGLVKFLNRLGMRG
jgi:hypothetical protein